MIAVGLSGGVDSAVTAYLLKARGEDVVGVMMTLGRVADAQAVADAQTVAKRLDIPLHVCDLATLWKSQVLDYIADTYRAGRTPNPCVRCNECVKFSALPRWAFAHLGCDRFATGHYARLDKGRLLRGVDHKKDQSYFLYRVDREILSRTILPLGAMTKDEVRTIAREQALVARNTALMKDSQDFCGGDPQALVGDADRSGDVVTLGGKVIGTHRGYWHYTVGQRKGLGIGGGTPYYIVRIDATQNRVIVGCREEAVSHTLALTDTIGEIDLSLPVKVRSAGEPRLLADGIVGIAPGQSAVFYRGEEVVGGGIICRGLKGENTPLRGVGQK